MNRDEMIKRLKGIQAAVSDVCDLREHVEAGVMDLGVDSDEIWSAEAAMYRVRDAAMHAYGIDISEI